MARACTVCTHPDRHQIERRMMDSGVIRTIAADFGLTESSLKRHRKEHLALVLAENLASSLDDPQPIGPEAIERKVTTERVHVLDLTSQLTRQIERVNDLSDAVDAWLRDPDDPTKYNIGPRSYEVSVVYYDYDDTDRQGNPRRKKAPLQELLNRAEKANIHVETVEARVADPRELLLKAQDGIKNLAQSLTMILDKIYGAQQAHAFESAVLEAIAEVAPDVRTRIEANLRRSHALRQLAGLALR